ADAVGYRTGAMVLRAAAAQKVTGTQEPLLMEESQQLREMADYLEKQALEIEGAVGTGAAESPFAMPTAAAAGIAVGPQDWSPLQKLVDLDVRDNVLPGTAPGTSGTTW